MPRTPDGGWLLDDSEITKFEPSKKKKEKKKNKEAQGAREKEKLNMFNLLPAPWRRSWPEIEGLK